MKIDKLRIGCFIYSVALSPDLRESNYDGRLAHGKSAILLADDMDAQATLQTLLHEVIHEIAIQAGQKVNEGLVDAMAYGWIQTMRDNPQLVRAITKR